MSGIFGGGQKTTTQIPAWVEDAAKRNLSRADQIAQIGYTPYYGADVAAFTPMQDAAFANTGQAANAFGLPSAAGNGMPAPQTFAGGVQGYSSGGMFDQALAALRAARPGQAAAIDALFINPQTGAAGNGMTPTTPAVIGGQQMVQGVGGMVPAGYTYQGSGNGMQSNTTSAGPGGGFSLPGGYTGLMDMFNGGGPAASGGAYKGGGLLSGISNFVKGR